MKLDIAMVWTINGKRWNRWRERIFIFSWSLAMLGNREGNKTGEGLTYKNKWERHEDFSTIQEEKESIGKNGISFNNWSEIPGVAFMGSREQREELALVTMRNLLS